MPTEAKAAASGRGPTEPMPFSRGTGLPREGKGLYAKRSRTRPDARWRRRDSPRKSPPHPASIGVAARGHRPGLFTRSPRHPRPPPDRLARPRLDTPARNVARTAPWGSERRPVMLRFPCPQCGKALKVPAEQAGQPVVCPRCGEPSAAGTPTAAERDEAGRPPAWPSEQARGPFRSMSAPERWAVALVAGAGAVTLVLAALSPLLPAPRGVARAAADWA